MKSKLLIICVLLFALTAALSGCFGGRDNKDSVPTKTYTVTFDTDGGSQIPSVTLEEGERLTPPSAPSKLGFLFAGWMLDGTLFSFNTPVYQDITLTASWNEDPSYQSGEVTVTFLADGQS